MLFSIPIYVEESPAKGAQAASFVARPLFFPEPSARAEKLTRTLSKLGNSLRDTLKDLGEEPRHTSLARWAFSPLLDDAVRELRLDLAKPVRREFFLAGYTALDRKIYFTPKLPTLHFEVLPGQDLAERAADAIGRHLRELEKEAGDLDLDDYAIVGKARLTAIEIELHPATLAKKPEPERRAQLFRRSEKMDGERELRKVGRSLQAMYPDDLDRALGREREVDELARLFAAADRRPIVLVGPRKVGKTAILHELAWQIGARKAERFAGKREIWLVSPMRLISGMSVVGEWENRVLAILDHATKKDLVLYFDDLPGLFNAGVSSASDLNVAQALLPALEKRNVRVVAEVTPEAWRVLRERDRRFADLFQVIPIEEPSELETKRALVSIIRQLESDHATRFDIDVVPTVFELCRRHIADAAFPGKAAGFLKHLAAASNGEAITRPYALNEFSAQTGLQLRLLNDAETIERSEILASLRKHVVGQEPALEAFADVFLILKARLNDPRRPLGAMLLLGPTGVGKTQAAKALARTLFGGEKSLIRFDMNEFVDAGAVARLAGTPREPDGLLTSAIRRQPFSVALFDEIEKAAPEAFDLLLAVLDEGRLTDSLGRIADFTQSVILLTSNLGATEARSRLGFGEGANADTDAHYIGAAEKFFRPEFFNRLTRVIPFRPLTREHLEGIARQLLDALFARDGLRRRDAILNVAPEAMTRLVQLGHHPQLGARALRRVVEREIGQPVAARLAAIPPGSPIIANISATANAFELNLRDLAPVARSITWPDKLAIVSRDDILDAVFAALDRIDAVLSKSEPSGAIDLGKLSPVEAHYYFCREQFGKVERFAQSLERAARRPAGVRAKIPKAKALKIVVRQIFTVPTRSPHLGRLRAAASLRGEMEEAYHESKPEEASLMSLVGELSWLEALIAEPAGHQRALLTFEAMTDAETPTLFRIAPAFHACLSQLWGIQSNQLLRLPAAEEALLKRIFSESVQRTAAYCLTGNLSRIFPTPTVLFQARQSSGPIGLISVTIRPVASEKEAKTEAERMQKKPAAANFGPVTHLLQEGKQWLDCRTGIAIPEEHSPEEFRTALLAALPLAPELGGLFEEA